MTRITLALEDNLLQEMKKRAAAEGQSLQAVANQLIRQGLAAPSRPRYRLKLQGWKAELQPGVDILDRDSLLQVLDQPRKRKP